MSRQDLKEAWRLATQPDPTRTQLAQALRHLTAHAAEQQAKETPSQANPAASSSEVTEMATETPPTLGTSSTWSFRVNRDGTLPPSAEDSIWDWLNSQLRLGKGQEVEIGVTLTSKGSTLPDGSPLPSTEAPAPVASGHAGDYLGESAGYPVHKDSPLGKAMPLERMSKDTQIPNSPDVTTGRTTPKRMWRCPSPRCNNLNFSGMDHCALCHESRPLQEEPQYD